MKSPQGLQTLGIKIHFLEIICLNYSGHTGWARGSQNPQDWLHNTEPVWTTVKSEHSSSDSRDIFQRSFIKISLLSLSFSLAKKEKWPFHIPFLPS
jgi:hypothetical protein